MTTSHTNSKLHDRAETKVISVYEETPKTLSNPKNSPLGPQKVKKYPKLSQNQKLEVKKL